MRPGFSFSMTPHGDARPHEKTSTTTLSVGVPTYNQSGFLRQTIVSLIEQDTPPLEIVVSDNHSTDATPDILRDFSRHLTIVRPPERLSMMQNWNFVASHLTGDWFSLLSSDDVALPSYVKILLRGTTRSRQAVLVRAAWENIDAEGSPISQHYLLSVRRRVTPPQTLHENINGPKGSFAAFATKRSIWQSVGGFPTTCRLFGDWAFWIRISSRGDFIYEPEVISQYRTNYRLGLGHARFWDETADEVEICTRIIPEAWAQLDGPNFQAPSTRDVLLRRMTTASQVLNGHLERQQFCELITSWGKAAKCDHLVLSFAQGANISHHKRPVWAAARNVLRSLHRVMRKIF